MSLVHWIQSVTPSAIERKSFLFLTIPHSGEIIPQECFWLADLPSETLTTDIDRYVDQLYFPAAQHLEIPALATQVHRYCADLNRYPSDVDSSTVEGAPASSGTFKKGFIWSETTQGAPLLSQPIPAAIHQVLTQRYHDPFHSRIQEALSDAHQKDPQKKIFHLDCHSMPSMGTGAHADAGSRRPDVVVSDWNGKSASPEFRDVTIEAFRKLGLAVSLNHPYQGGRITQRYGKPELGHETLQIELNRALYMSETGDRPRLSPQFEKLQTSLEQVLREILSFTLST